MQAFLEVWSTVGGHDVRPLVGPRLTLGRDAATDLAVQDAEVSRVHACLELIGQTWIVRDLSSRNGTTVNGDRVVADRPLASGDEIRVGSTRLVFRAADAGTLEPTAGAEPAPVLTPRERDVLLELFRPTLAPGAFTEPASTRDIASALVVSEAAVKQHLGNLYDKFGLHAGLDRRRMRLANEALRRGAVTLGEVRAAFGGQA